MSWPWKKKSSEKAAIEKVAAILDSAGTTLASTRSQAEQEKYKKPNYVQISLETYSHLFGLEDQVKTCEEQVRTLENQIKELNEKLSAAESEVSTKDNLVKQHSKVAEEAVSGWEKAETEALTLKNHLETLTLDKLTAEDRALHLDGALKECMRQIRNLKEEHEKNLQEVVLTKTKQWEKIKHEFEAKIGDLDQELLKSAAENAALSRSLQEHSNMLIKITEEKSHADVEIELLKSNIEACEREINSLKYELHVVTKELEIRNEEKNMSMRSAEVANKLHMEGTKKIAKLEAECQRLRGLVRKKLPGPAALAQMKLEVENSDRDHRGSNLKRSPIKPPSPGTTSLPDYSFENYQKFHKENEFLTERLLAREEEMKMLKEALAKRNSELQASRNMCAKTATKLQVLEAQLQSNSQNSPKYSVPAESSLSHNASNPPSLTSVSEDGNDDERSCAVLWPSASISELFQFNKKKNAETLKKANSANHLNLMDDFLEMEKLACSSNDLNGSMYSPESSVTERPDSLKDNASAGKQLDSLEALTASTRRMPLADLESRILAIFRSISMEEDTIKTLDNVKKSILDVCNNSQEHGAGIFVSKVEREQGCPDEASSVEKHLKLSEDAKQAAEANKMICPDLEAAIIRIHDFVLFLGKEIIGVHGMSTDGDELDQQIRLFSVTLKNVICGDASLSNFILEFSHILSEASDIKFNIMGYRGAESLVNSPDYIDKLALPDNDKTGQQDPAREPYQNGNASSSYLLPSQPQVSADGTLESDEANVHTVLLEDYEKLRSENDIMATRLARSAEDLEAMKSQLEEMEQMQGEVNSQLALAQKSFSLAETQLKCMVESYRALEMRAQELETELNLLRAKMESLDTELQEEKRAHQNALDRSRDLQEQLESLAQESDANIKSKQEIELAAAAEKLADCQQTIFLLGKQLNALRPPNTKKIQNAEAPFEYQTTRSGMSSLEHSASADYSGRAGALSPVDLYSNNPGSSPSETELGLLRSPLDSNHSGHRPTLSGSSTPCSTPEKQSRGLNRFLSSQGKNSA